MDLTKLKPFIHGAVKIYEDNGYICFSRFTDAQERVIISRDFAYHINSTGGVRIEFLTHGGKLSFDYSALIGSINGKAFFGIEICVDGLSRFNFYSHEEKPDDGRVEFDVSQSEKASCVSVYFPNFGGIKIKNVVLPDDATPYQKNLKLLAFGDSITLGGCSVHANQTYAQILADRLNAELLNQGIGGEHFFADNIDPDLPFNPDIITVAYGVNDWGHKLLFTDAPKDFFKKLYNTYPDKKIFSLLPTYYKYENEIVDGHTLVEGREYIRAVAEMFPNVTVIDCSDFIPPLPDYFTDDIMLHPNDMGFLYYGHKLANIIVKENYNACK